MRSGFSIEKTKISLIKNNKEYSLLKGCVRFLCINFLALRPYNVLIIVNNMLDIYEQEKLVKGKQINIKRKRCSL